MRINKCMNLFKISFSGLFALVLLSGCAASVNYDNVNPNPTEVKQLKKGSEVLKELYIKQGRIQGEAIGFQKGLEYSKNAFAELMNDIRAKQFAIYLYKERFIEAGPIYINPTTGEIELGKMELRKPFTVADIYKYYGAELPVKSEAKINEELEKINEKLIEMQSSVSPDIIKKEKKSYVVDKTNVNGHFVKIYNTKSNVGLLKGLQYKYGVIDDKLMIKFDDIETINNFCRNFGECIRD